MYAICIEDYLEEKNLKVLSYIYNKFQLIMLSIISTNLTYQMIFIPIQYTINGRSKNILFYLRKKYITTRLCHCQFDQRYSIITRKIIMPLYAYGQRTIIEKKIPSNRCVRDIRNTQTYFFLCDLRIFSFLYFSFDLRRTMV